MEFGKALPRVRAVVERHLQGQGLSRDRVLAAAVRLIDLGFFRPGGEEYAAENGSFGLATIRRRDRRALRDAESRRLGCRVPSDLTQAPGRASAHAGSAPGQGPGRIRRKRVTIGTSGCVSRPRRRGRGSRQAR